MWSTFSVGFPHNAQSPSTSMCLCRRASLDARMSLAAFQAKCLTFWGRFILHRPFHAFFLAEGFEQSALPPPLFSSKASQYVLLTINFPLGVSAHINLSLGRCRLNGMHRIASASSSMKQPRICYVFHSMDALFMRSQTRVIFGQASSLKKAIKVLY